MARLPAGIRRSELVELLDISEKLKPLVARQKELVEKAKHAHRELEAATYPYGPVVLLLKESRTFDPDAFAAKYSIEKHPDYYGQVVISKQVPEALRKEYAKVSRSLEIKRAAGTKPAQAR